MKANIEGACICFPNPKKPVQLRLLQQLWLITVNTVAKSPFAENKQTTKQMPLSP